MNYLVLTTYRNVSYIAGHERAGSSVYRVYSVGNNILMRIFELYHNRTVQRILYLLLIDYLCTSYVGDGIKSVPMYHSLIRMTGKEYGRNQGKLKVRKLMYNKL